MTIKIGGHTLVYSATVLIINEMDAWVDFSDPDRGNNWKYHIVFVNDAENSNTRFGCIGKTTYGEMSFTNFNAPIGQSSKDLIHIGTYSNGDRLLTAYFIESLGNSKKVFIQFVREEDKK